MAAITLLSDRRPIRAMDGSVTQMQMFQLRGRFDPQVEGIARVRDLDNALNGSRVFDAAMGVGAVVRARQFGVYLLNPEAKLGREMVYSESGFFYRHLVPDVPVTFSGKEISLQNAVGMCVYDSIDLLRVEQTDDEMFTVSAADLSTLAGRVRVIDFTRNDYGQTDEHGFPLESRPATFLENPGSRYGFVLRHFVASAYGWQGSFTRYRGDLQYAGNRIIDATCKWSADSKVALVGHQAIAQHEADS